MRISGLSKQSGGTSDQISVDVVLSSVSRNAGGVFDAVKESCAIVYNDDRFKINVHGVRDDRTDRDLWEWHPVPAFAYPRVGPVGFAHAPSMHRSILRSASTDIIHQHGLWQSPSRVVLRWRRKTQKPVIISPHGMLDEWALQNSRIKKSIAASIFERANLQGASCLHALNQSELASIRAFGLDSAIAVIPNGVSLPQSVNEEPNRPKEVRQKKLLFLGRIHPKKGLASLIEAWRILRDSGSPVLRDWRVEIAGWDDGGHLRRLEEMVSEYSLKEQIIFLGPLFGEDKVNVFRSAHAFVLPSHSEGLPMAILEAWSYRLPVFKTEACNLPAGFKSGAAIKIDPSPASIAKAMATHLGRGDLATIGERGYRLVAENYSWQSIGHQLRELYIWLKNGSPHSDKPSFIDH